MLSWLGKIVYHGRWFVLLAAVLAVGAASFYGKDAIAALDSDIGHTSQSASQQAQTILDTRLSATRVDMVILFQSDTMHARDPLFQIYENAALQPLQGNPDIASIQTYSSTGNADFISRDGHESFATIRLVDQKDPHDVYDLVRTQVKSLMLRVSLGGPVPADRQFSAQTADDLKQMEFISFPIVALALVLVFDGLLAALLPLVIGGVAIIGALAGLRALTLVLTISAFAANIVSVLGLGLAIDYSLFIVTRFREELARSPQDTRGALQRTLKTAGRTVFFSGLTVSTCLVSLTFFPEITLRSLGVGAIAAVLVAMLAALTILPAILAVLGRRVNALALSRLFRRRKSQAQQNEAGAWYRLSQLVMRFPIPVMALTLALLIALGTPFTRVTFAAPDIHALPASQSARYVADRLTADFPQQSGSTQTIALLTPGDAFSNDNLAALHGYVQQIQALPHVTNVTSIVTLNPRLRLADYEYLYSHPQANPRLYAAAQALANGDATEIAVTVDGADNSGVAQQAVHALRALAPPAGFTAYVGGTTATQIDLFDTLRAHLLPAVLMIVLSTFVLLFLMTGSVVVPLKAIILNTLSLTATFGAVVFVFQEGHFARLLDFTSVGAIDPSQMMILFAIAFGLSMDYEVFLISRIKEQYDLTNDNRLAVASGLQRTGRLITSAALLLAIVLLATISSQIIFIKELGLGLALAVIMDATVVRALLVPATMRLLGRANWWPNVRAFGEREEPPAPTPSQPLAPEKEAALAATLRDRDPNDSAAATVTVGR